MAKRSTVREAARNRRPLDGADSQALEHALMQAEDEAIRMRSFLEQLLLDLAPTRPAGDAGAELVPLYRLEKNDARNLSHRIRRALGGTGFPPGFERGGLVSPSSKPEPIGARTDDEVPLCRPEDT
jgi:hypothetical protein